MVRSTSTKNFPLSVEITREHPYSVGMQLTPKLKTNIVIVGLALLLGFLGLTEYKRYITDPAVTGFIELFFSDSQKNEIPPTPSPLATPIFIATSSARLLGAEIATVAAVIDGDTITLQDGKKVRYIGIDAPETSSSDSQVKCFHAEATAENERLVLGKEVQLVKDKRNTDKYGRLLRYVYVNSTSVNEQLVAGGFARAKWYPPDTAAQKEIDAAQAQAQQEKRGLWGVCFE